MHASTNNSFCPIQTYELFVSDEGLNQVSEVSKIASLKFPFEGSINFEVIVKNQTKGSSWNIYMKFKTQFTQTSPIKIAEVIFLKPLLQVVYPPILTDIVPVYSAVQGNQKRVILPKAININNSTSQVKGRLKDPENTPNFLLFDFSTEQIVLKILNTKPKDVGEYDIPLLLEIPHPYLPNEKLVSFVNVVVQVVPAFKIVL